MISTRVIFRQKKFISITKYIRLQGMNEGNGITLGVQVFSDQNNAINMKLIILISFYSQKQIQSGPMSEKPYFGCMDYRNAKYQGSIRDNSLDGIGIVLDNQFMLALSTWKNQVPYGPSIIIFPNRDYLYGKFRNRKLNQICCYVASTGETYFFNFVDGVSESIAYIDNNSTIVQIDNRGSLQKINSFIKQKQADNKWRIISNILKAQITEDYQNYKSFLKATLHNEFNDVLQCTEHSNMAFIGFKNTISLGFKFDKNNQARQVGNFQEFPRNIEFGRKITVLSSKDVKIQQGKFIQPEQIYVYKKDKRSIESIRQTEKYFKKGTNFKNQFLRLNIFIQLSKYFSDVKTLSQNLRVFEFGQQILQNQYQTREKDLEGQANRQYDLSQMKKVIYDAANKKAKITSRSPSRQLDTFNNDYEYKQLSPRKVSNEKYQYLKQDKDQKIRPFERSKESYKYVNSINETEVKMRNSIKQRDYALKYNLTPQVSDFDNFQRNYRNQLLAGKPTTDRYIEQKMQNIKIQGLRREQAILNSYQQALQVSPIMKLHRTPTKYPLSKSPLRSSAKPNENQERSQRFNYQQQQTKYRNYLDYKNRNKDKQQQRTPQKQQQQNTSPQKYKIYERKVLGPSNLTPQKEGISDMQKLFLVEKMTLNPNQGAQKILPGRYKKSFKYLQ